MTTPDQTNNWIDTLLTEIVPVKVAVVSDHEGKVWEKDTNRLKRQQAKAIIEAKLLEARIDELEYVDERGGATTRLAALQNQGSEGES